MLDTLKIQKNKLIKAKETINLRRKFTEKIINEVNNELFIRFKSEDFDFQQKV